MCNNILNLNTMDIKEFIENFAEQFDETDASEITAETKFRELEEWSSLISMGVIAMMKVNYGKALTGTEMRSCETVQDLFNLVSSK